MPKRSVLPFMEWQRKSFALLSLYLDCEHVIMNTLLEWMLDKDPEKYLGCRNIE